MSRAPGRLVVHHRSRGVAMGTLDGFFVMRCFGAVSPEDIRATLQCSEVLKAYRPEGAASLVAVDPTSTFPSEETRRAALQVSRQTTAETLALVIVVLGDGFWASAIRGVLTTLTSLSPTDSAHPRKVVRHEEEGVDWLIEAVGESPPKYRSVLLAALNQLKQTVTSPPAPNSKAPAPISKAPAPGSKAPEATFHAPAATSKVHPSKRRSG